ncbi:hypothetical protein [Metallibacterium scheffleri]|uniref:hypothetical protein n=1 Tax=Metallibacterium scheffleri TaxID=993689 RepID=UPI0023EF6D59|nr:hypothetical protein [Metallibacterium scheffleri]
MDVNFNLNDDNDTRGAALAIVIAQLLDQNNGSFDFRPGRALELAGGNARGSDRTDYRAVPRLRRLGIEPVRVGKRWLVRVGDLARVLVGTQAASVPSVPRPRGSKRRIAGCDA